MCYTKLLFTVWLISMALFNESAGQSEPTSCYCFTGNTAACNSSGCASTTAGTGTGFVGANCAYGDNTAAGGFSASSSVTANNFGCCAGAAGRSGPTNGPPNGCADPRYGCSGNPYTFANYGFANASDCISCCAFC
ncbi:unnamed protein product, partial [Rotaria socialis]